MKVGHLDITYETCAFRVIKSCSENCIPSYLEEAAVLCLKDKLMAFAANQSGISPRIISLVLAQCTVVTHHAEACKLWRHAFGL